MAWWTRTRERTVDGSVDPRGRPAGPPSASAPGSRRLERGFFEDFPLFLETSTTSAFPWRLNLRHEAIFTEHAGLFPGARVLDIASHDGRWTFAALRAGAASVQAIEARPDLVAHARANLAAYGADTSRVEFVAGDVFEVLEHERPEVELVLCLGFLEHTLRHTELLTRIRQTGARHVLVDTEIHGDPEPVVRLADEHVEREGNAVADAFTCGDTVLTGRPSAAALELLARTQGFRLVGYSDWAGLLRDNPEADQVRDYRTGRRVTALLSAAESRSR